MRRWIWAACLGLVLAGLVPATAGSDPNAYTVSSLYISSADGTQLETWVYRPAGLADSDQTPVVMMITPYANSGGTALGPTPTGSPDPTPSFALNAGLFAHGYTYVIVELRGYGGSGGCFDYAGPNEQADAKAAVEWAAAQPWSTGRVGIYGHSYDATGAVMALATHAKGLAAVVAWAPQIGYGDSYMNGVATPSALKPELFYSPNELTPPSVNDTPEHQTTHLTGLADPSCQEDHWAGSTSNDPSSSWWQARDLVAKAAGTTVPTMLIQGFNDWNVRPTQILSLYQALRGPRRAWFGPWDHSAPVTAQFYSEIDTWFDRYLKGAPLDTGPTVELQNADSTWRAEPTWPPPPAKVTTWPLLPGSYLDAAGNNGETGFPQQVPIPLPSGVALPTGQGSWTFTPPLTHAVHLAGVPQLSVSTSKVTPRANLIGLLYDVDESGNATFVSRGAYQLRADGQVTFGLYPQDWIFPAGHRIGVLLSGSDDLWFIANDSATPVTVTGGTLALPVAPVDFGTALPSGPLQARTPHPPFQIPAPTITSRTSGVNSRWLTTGMVLDLNNHRGTR